MARNEEDGSAIARGGPLTLPPAPKAFGPAARVRQTLAVARDSIREMATRWSWLLLPYCFLHAAVAIGEMGVRGTPVFPTTERVLAGFYQMPPPFIISMFVFGMLFAGELVWRERDANMNMLADAAPVPVAVRFAGKLLGLWTVITALHALLMLTDIAMQLHLGARDIDLPLYLQVLFGMQLPVPLLFTLVALSVHALVNHKHVGTVAVLAAAAGGSAIVQTLGIEHPLLIPFRIPGWRHSPISGFDPYVGPYLWFLLYWASWALLLAIVACLFWARGVRLSLRERVRVARCRFRGPMRAAAAVVVGLIAVVGAFLFYNTNVLNEYRSSADVERLQAEYERLYGRSEAAPQPRLTAAKLNVELDPKRHAADVHGVSTLVNRTARAIDTIHVAVSADVDTGDIAFDRPARATVLDDTRGHRTYALARPLEPGQSMSMRWQVRHAPRGFTARGIDTAVVGNGTFIPMATWMPQIGYQPSRELNGATQRKKHGLAPRRDDARSLGNVAARFDPTGQELFDLDTTVGTVASQTAVAPGELLGVTTRNGRRYFHYASQPIGQGFAIFSAEYAVARARFGDVAVEVFYHPADDRNLPRMLRSVQLSLAQYGARFGRYPYRVLRLIEYTRKDGGAHSAHANIWYSELFPLLDPAHDERRIDLPFAVMAHEVAHQFQVAPARMEGRGLLSESFAWYAALGVIEQQYGADHLARFLAFLRLDFLEPRSRADVPLVRASDWLDSYRRGPFAMYALREYVGQPNVDLAWRRLIEKHPAGQPPFATSLDLLHELRPVTPAALQPLLGDLLERNTFWSLAVRSVAARPAASGAWQVTLEVTARKEAVDENGAVTAMPMNDPIEIGVFGAAQAGQPNRPLYLAMHRIRSGVQTIAITVPRKPTRAAIDPRHLLVELEPNDNDAEIASH